MTNVRCEIEGTTVADALRCEELRQKNYQEHTESVRESF